MCVLAVLVVLNVRALRYKEEVRWDQEENDAQDGVWLDHMLRLGHARWSEWAVSAVERAGELVLPPGESRDGAGV